MEDSGGDSVGKVVASNIRDLRFENQHRQSFIYQLLLNRKDENKEKEKEKEAGNGPSFYLYLMVECYRLKGISLSLSLVPLVVRAFLSEV